MMQQASKVAASWMLSRNSSQLLQTARLLTAHTGELRMLPASLATEEICPDAKALQSLPQHAQEEEKTVVMLHGLLGSGRNWRSFAKRLVAAAAEQGSVLRVLLVDLRNHGESTKIKSLHPPHSLETAAADIQALVHRKLRGAMPSVVMGHSLGGKVALELLQQMRVMKHSLVEGLATPEQVWVLDSQPGMVEGRAGGGDSVAAIIDTIKRVPLPVPSREWLYQHLQELHMEPAIVYWLGSNLVPRKGGGFTWAFNIQGAAAMYHSYRVSSYWELLGRPPPGTRIHVVRAANSDRWTPAMVTELQAAEDACKAAQDSGGAVGHLTTHVLPDAGHWLHSDNPDGLLKMLLPWLLDPQGRGAAGSAPQ